MNILRKCRNDLTRIGQSLSQLLNAEPQGCGCHTQTTVSAASANVTCGCGQDTCQIGDSANACQPRSQPLTEQAWGERS